MELINFPLLQNTMEEGESNVYEETDHSTKCFREMAQLWYNKQFCDVHLLVVDALDAPRTAVLAHKIVLAAVIPYFRAMFESQMKETEEKEIVLHNHTADAVKILVEYAYTGKVRVTPQTAQDLLVTADKFGLTNIAEFSGKYMGRQLCPSNCLGIREFAFQQNLTELHDIASSFVIQNFTATSKEDEFVQLPLEKVEELVQSDDIRVDSEEDVYHAVTLWIFQNSEERGKYADQLYDHIRFPLVPQSFIEKVVNKNPYLQSEKCQVYLKDAYEYYRNPGVTIFSNPKKTQPRRSIQGVICLVGGVDDGGTSLDSVTLYNPHEQEWKEGPKMRYRRSRLGVALFHGELYAVGGYDLGYSLTICEKYSPKDNEWKPIADLSTARRSLALVAVGNRLFALGGFTGSIYLKSVEAYNPSTDEWSPGPPMLESRSELAALFLDKKIYAVGGTNSSGHLKSVEVFDWLNKRWSMVATMAIPRTGAGELV